MAGFEPATFGCLTVVTPILCNNQGPNGSAIKSARHGRVQDKEKKRRRRLLNWLFSFRKFLLTEKKQTRENKFRRKHKKLKWNKCEYFIKYLSKMLTFQRNQGSKLFENNQRTVEFISIQMVISWVTLYLRRSPIMLLLESKFTCMLIIDTKNGG